MVWEGEGQSSRFDPKRMKHDRHKATTTRTNTRLPNSDCVSSEAVEEKETLEQGWAKPEGGPEEERHVPGIAQRFAAVVFGEPVVLRRCVL